MKRAAGRLLAVAMALLAMAPVQAGQDLNAIMDRNKAFLAAGEKGDVATLARMLDEGQDPNTVVDAQTALTKAASRHRYDAMKLLLQRGAKIQSKDFVNPMNVPAMHGQVEMVRFLMESGAKVNFLRPGDASPLWHASLYAKEPAVKILLDAGANPNLADPSYGQLPIQNPGGCSDRDVFRLLADAGSDLNHQDLDGLTVLHCATAQRHPDLVRYALCKRADKSLRDRYGRTPADLARHLRGAGLSAGEKEVILSFDQIIELLDGKEAKCPRGAS
jgi:uncharacterized protein